MSLAEGRAQLGKFAKAIPIEEWAGEVAGSTEIKKRFNISRSTLDLWAKKGVVVSLLAGAKKHVYPTSQFVDGRPVEGLADVVSIVGAPRAAWHWLATAHTNLDGERPIDVLRAGRRKDVLALAKSDYSQL